MTRTRLAQRAAVVAVLAATVCLLVAAPTSASCWCESYEELVDEVPTRSSSILFDLGVTAATAAVSVWVVDLLDFAHPEWFKLNAMLAGIASAASTLAGLPLPSSEEVNEDQERITLAGGSGGGLCAEAMEKYAKSARDHRYASGAVKLGTGAAHLLLFSPYGEYGRGEVWDYGFLVSGILSMAFGLGDLLFLSPFERDYQDVLLTSGERS